MKYGIMILILTLSWGFGQCDGLTEVELWGETYDIETTT